MRIHRLLAVLAVPVLAAGCVTPSSQMGFDHPLATEAEFLFDRDQCLQRTMGWLTPAAADVRHVRLFEECMAERGYTRNDTGRLVPPAATG